LLVSSGALFYRGPIIVEKRDQGNFWYEIGIDRPAVNRKWLVVPLAGFAAVGVFFLVVTKRKAGEGF